VSQPDPEERLDDQPDGDLDENKRNDDKPEKRHDRPEGEPGHPIYEGLWPRRAVVVALEDAVVGVTSSSLSPHVSVVHPAHAGRRYHVAVVC
jgi:hypothetical protein